MRKITNCFIRERTIYNGKNAVPTGEFLRTESGEFEKEILCFEKRMESEKMDKEANKKKKYSSLKERIEEYYGKSFEEVCAERDCFGEEMKEIDFGGPVGEEYW